MGRTATAGVAKAKPKSNASKQHRLSDTDKGLALRYANDGVSQTIIAQRLGVTQPAISQWLSKCQDATDAARLYLRGQSLSMAEKLVQRGKRGSDKALIAGLQGVGVLADERAAGLTIQIGIKDSDVQISLSPGESAGMERKVTETLTIEAGSDKAGYVNQ